MILYTIVETYITLPLDTSYLDIFSSYHVFINLILYLPMYLDRDKYTVLFTY